VGIGEERVDRPDRCLRVIVCAGEDTAATDATNGRGTYGRPRAGVKQWGARLRRGGEGGQKVWLQRLPGMRPPEPLMKSTVSVRVAGSARNRV
jgi:hypothetical protein